MQAVLLSWLGPADQTGRHTNVPARPDPGPYVTNMVCSNSDCFLLRRVARPVRGASWCESDRPGAMGLCARPTAISSAARGQCQPFEPIEGFGCRKCLVCEARRCERLPSCRGALTSRRCRTKIANTFLDVSDNVQGPLVHAEALAGQTGPRVLSSLHTDGSISAHRASFRTTLRRIRYQWHPVILLPRGYRLNGCGCGLQEVVRLLRGPAATWLRC